MIRFGVAVLFIIGCVAGIASLVGRSFEKLAPPVIAVLPPFGLIDSDNQVVSKATLTGKISVVHFFFSTCHDVCPATFGRLAALEQELPAGVQLLSITIDPERDTPEVLRKYRERFAAGSARWKFATGAQREIETLAERGFMVAVGPEKELHSARVFLVDSAVTVRGIYKLDEDAERGMLLRDVGAVLQQE